VANDDRLDLRRYQYHPGHPRSSQSPARDADGSVGGWGAKLRIAIVEANLGASGNSKNTQVSRIQFSVPLVMPKNPRDWSNERSSIATVRED
jgi:hypothetical protein